jgi:prevent-host-death family protein
MTNMVIRNVADAKANLSQLIEAALSGEEVVLARYGKPLVRLVPIEPPAQRPLGFVATTVPDLFFAALDLEELEHWN